MKRKRRFFAAVICLLTALLLFGCVKGQNTDISSSSDIIETPAPTPKPDDRVSFIARGDNLIHGAIYLQARRRATDGGYDFDYAYENIEYYFEDFDVKFINQETCVNDAFEPSTYPLFSSPIELGEKVVEMGFNVIGTSNNHSYDKGAAGVRSTLNYWNGKDVVNVGYYTGNDDTDIKYLTVNNIKMAFLAYTSYTNGLKLYDDTCPYVIYTDDFDTIDRQVAIAKANADVVIVSCHWGIEGTNEVSDNQYYVADHLNKIGVDVIIGTHPHVIQKCEWRINDENGNKTLICYSLGNFISAQSQANNMIAGLFQFDIVKKYDINGDYKIEIENPYFVPTITHYDYNYSNIRNYILKDYTPELAANHGVRNTDARFSYNYVENIVNSVIPKEFLLYN